MDIAIYNDASWGRRTSRTSSTWPAAPHSRIAASRISRSGRLPGAAGPRRGRSATGRTTSPLSGRRRAYPDRRASCSAPPSPQGAARTPVILAGRGRHRRAEELEEWPRLLGAPIVKALWARPACPTTARSRPAAIGLLGTRPSQDALEGCDTLLIVGSSFPLYRVLPENRAGALRADRHRPERIGLRYPVEVGLVGDASAHAARAAAAARRGMRTAASWSRRRKAMPTWGKLMEERGTPHATCR